MRTDTVVNYVNEEYIFSLFNAENNIGKIYLIPNSRNTRLPHDAENSNLLHKRKIVSSIELHDENCTKMRNYRK